MTLFSNSFIVFNLMHYNITLMSFFVLRNYWDTVYWALNVNSWDFTVHKAICYNVQRGCNSTKQTLRLFINPIIISISIK